jgi:hypothetical protein
MDFKYEEDVEAAVAVATEILGKPGRMLEAGRNVNHNVTLEGPRRVKLWYGDLDLAVDMKKVEILGSRLGIQVNIMKENDYPDIRLLKG